MFSDDTLFYIVSTSCVAFAIWLLTRRKTPPNYPPGPKGFPLIGVLPYVTSSTQKSFAKWSQENYGPVMSVKLLGHDLVVLNTYDAMKQVRSCFLNFAILCSILLLWIIQYTGT